MTRQRKQKADALAAIAGLSETTETSSLLAPKERKHAPTVPESRIGKHHFGAYIDNETQGRLVILKYRLNLNNTDIATRAINEMYARMMTEGK